MAMTPQQIQVAFQSAFGRGATKEELSYWSKKTQAQLAGGLGANANRYAYNPETKTYVRKAATPAAPPATPGVPSIGEPYDTMLKEMNSLLDEITKRGQAVNPNIEITPEKVAEFMKQAEGEINPYYGTQLKLAREGFLSSMGYDKDSIEQNEANLERKYSQAFRGIGESEAEAGFALSGRRQQAESDLDTDVNQQVSEGRRALGARETELARAFGQAYGGQALKDVGAPTISGTPRFGGGAVNRAGGNQNLYQLSPDIYDQLVGSQEFARRGAVQSRASELESAFRQGRSIDQLRRLTI